MECRGAGGVHFTGHQTHGLQVRCAGEGGRKGGKGKHRGWAGYGGVWASRRLRNGWLAKAGRPGQAGAGRPGRAGQGRQARQGNRPRRCQGTASWQLLSAHLSESRMVGGTCGCLGECCSGRARRGDQAGTAGGAGRSGPRRQAQEVVMRWPMRRPAHCRHVSSAGSWQRMGELERHASQDRPSSSSNATAHAQHPPQAGPPPAAPAPTWS